MLHDPALRSEIFSGVSGVHYPDETGASCAPFTTCCRSRTNRRVRLEVSAPDADPHIPSVTATYPAANWHERETWTSSDRLRRAPGADPDRDARRLQGHPQRKDYPLGGIPVEYRGHEGARTDERRAYS